MNSGSHKEVSPQSEETEFGGPPLQKQRKIIYFSSGETLELENSEEDEAEEQRSHRTPFKGPGRRARISFKNVAILVGRMSLLGNRSSPGGPDREHPAFLWAEWESLWSNRRPMQSL
ncbi:uncharacterized protein FYW61_020050 [Anableps anableps]